MIATIEGRIIEATPLMAIVETGGIGYEIHIPITTAEKLPVTGKSFKLFTHAVYREDNHSLYGFAEREDRDFFRMLVERVSGIGPKIALNIMSRMSSATLKQAISKSDVALLSKCPGIGKKTAERLVVELRDKVFHGSNCETISTASPDGGFQPSSIQDAVAALVTLGYKPADADKAARKALSVLGSEASTQALIKQALAG